MLHRQHYDNDHMLYDHNNYHMLYDYLFNELHLHNDNPSGGLLLSRLRQRPCVK